MSEVLINGPELERRFVEMDHQTDTLDRTLNGFPDAVDAGAAQDDVMVLFQTAIEAVTNLADTHRAIIAVARDVCQDIFATEEDIASDLADLRDEFTEPS